MNSEKEEIMRITLLAALIYSIGVCGANLSFAAEPETEVAPLATKPPADGTKPGQQLQLPITFDTQAGTIIKGIKGVVTATQQPLAINYLASNRTAMLRERMLEALIAVLTPTKVSEKFKPFKVDGTYSSLPSPKDVLCRWRGKYQVLAAQAVYLSAVSDTLSKLDTPVESKNIIDAFISLFSKKLSIDIAVGKEGTEQTIMAKCEADLEGNWPTTYYTTNKGEEAIQGLLPLSEITTLLGVAQKIVDFLNTMRQQREIAQYLYDNKSTITTAANNLVQAERALVASKKNYVIGHFADQMAVIAAFSIDLSQIEACRISAVSQISIPVSGKDAIGENPKAIASNAFASCYAQVWQKVSDDADAVITAASEYDTLPTVGSDPEDQLGDAVKRLGTNIDALSRTGRRLT